MDHGLPNSGPEQRHERLNSRGSVPPSRFLSCVSHVPSEAQAFAFRADLWNGGGIPETDQDNGRSGTGLDSG